MIEPTYRKNARTLGVPVQGYWPTGKKFRPADVVRADCFDRLYGAGWGLVITRSAQALDRQIAAGIAARRGEYGSQVRESQATLCAGRNALTEYRRLTGLKRRRPNDEAAQLALARENLSRAEVLMNRISNR